MVIGRGVRLRFGPAQEADAPIRFGELLALSSDPNSYRLILTPACDLVRCEASKKVLCVVGAGRDFNDAKSHAGARLYSKTQHLLVDLERRTSKLLSWNIDDVQTLPVSELSGEAFKRVAVMNELYAQEVKEEVLRQLGRVGTPIDPPPAAALRASVRWKVFGRVYDYAEMALGLASCLAATALQGLPFPTKCDQRVRLDPE